MEIEIGIAEQLTNEFTTRFGIGHPVNIGQSALYIVSAPVYDELVL
jgi:hypothetical protein